MILLTYFIFFITSYQRYMYVKFDKCQQVTHIYACGQESFTVVLTFKPIYRLLKYIFEL